jgi:separase
MLEAIEHKIPPKRAPDDLQWPVLSEDGDHLPRSNSTDASSKNRRFALTPVSDSEDEDDFDIKPENLKHYWDSVRMRYKSQRLSPTTLSSQDSLGLPATWTVINISVTPDKSTLFISRQEGGPNPTNPLIFCIPLKGRRDHGSGDDDENHLTFDGAIQELHDIVRSSDECTKAAISIKADDEEARCNWWKQRGQLDSRMRELLENIEYCWLGAFKASVHDLYSSYMLMNLAHRRSSAPHQLCRRSRYPSFGASSRRCFTAVFMSRIINPKQSQLDIRKVHRNINLTTLHNSYWTTRS